MTEQALDWIARDPDEATKKELQTLLTDPEQLKARFSGPLEFGTAGLRGIVGAGESRMNLAVVAVATAAVCDVLEAQVAHSKDNGIIIGHDARTGSIPFARAVATICAARGFKTWAFDHYASTPLVAFAAAQMKTAAAIVITASHNPPEYNGYKVYWDNAAQIIPPIDSLIRDAIVKRQAQGGKRILDDAHNARPRVHPAPSHLWHDYVQKAAALRLQPTLDLSKVRVAYTPMHGVGGRLLADLFAYAGVDNLASVAAQWEPDGTFPTVHFPNPEEPGAMDRLLALAKDFGADLALANDPDADRLAVAVPSPTGFRVLSGNEVGTILGAYCLERYHGRKKALVGNSVVSSPELSAIAHACGAEHLETLTGFKWIASAAMRREAEGNAPGGTPVAFLFAYEEALGYTVGTLVRDKDGISAALLMVELVASLRAQNQTIDDYQRKIAKHSGVWASVQKSLTLSGDLKTAVQALMQPLRSAPPKTLCGQAITSVHDYMHAARDLPPADMLLFKLGQDARLLIRPSGTEPKVKIYCDVRSPYQDDIAAARAAGISRANALIAALLDKPSA